MAPTNNAPSAPLAPDVWPLVTINILAYNRRDEVRETLRELQSVDYPREFLEILVVDNASSDGTKEMVEREFPDVKLVVIHPNRGIAGWNAGFETGRGEYFLVLDDDSALQSGLKEAITYLQQNPKVGILALKITGGWATAQSIEDNSELMGFVGCGALIRREVVDAIGGFAPWLYLYAHEWEYSLRCLDAGFDIRQFLGCTVHHRGSLSLRSFKKICVYSTRNNLLIIHKYFAKGRLLPMVRVVFHLLNWGRVEFGAERGRTPLYVLRGIGHFLRAKNQIAPTYVKPEVQKRYVRLYILTQPIYISLLKFASRRVPGASEFEKSG